MALIEGEEVECAMCGGGDGPFEYFDTGEYVCTDCLDDMESPDWEADDDDPGWD